MQNGERKASFTLTRNTVGHESQWMYRKYTSAAAFSIAVTTPPYVIMYV